MNKQTNQLLQSINPLLMVNTESLELFADSYKFWTDTVTGAYQVWGDTIKKFQDATQMQKL